MSDIDSGDATDADRRDRDATTDGVAKRSSLRRTTAKIVLVGAVLLHAGLIVRSQWDPHKLFGFQPFDESDTWQVELVRVLDDGSEVPIGDDSWTYDWNELVGPGGLQYPGGMRHASAGVPENVDFLQRAMDWVLDHIPDDDDTVALEATVTSYHNSHGPTVEVIRKEREPAR